MVRARIWGAIVGSRAFAEASCGAAWRLGVVLWMLCSAWATAQPADSDGAEAQGDEGIMAISDTSDVVDETDLWNDSVDWGMPAWADDGTGGGLMDFLFNAMGWAGMSMVAVLLLSFLLFLLLPVLLIILIVWLIVRGRRDKRARSQARFYYGGEAARGESAGSRSAERVVVRQQVPVKERRRKAVLLVVIGALLMVFSWWVIDYKFGIIIGLGVFVYGVGELIGARKKTDGDALKPHDDDTVS